MRGIRAKPWAALLLWPVLACSGNGDNTGDQFGEDETGTGTGTAGSGDGADASGGAAGATGGGSDGAGTDGPKYDVGSGAETGDTEDGGCGPDGDQECGCNAVDILFVIDNSESMGDHQVALGHAFPEFAGAIVDVLPADTSIHVGLTSTEMGFTSQASNNGCSYDGDANQYYVTPQDMNTGRNGAQGRLFTWEDRQYYEVSTDAPPEDIDALTQWFDGAVVIGTGGSNVEMSAAAAAWAAHPANGDSNAGFLRDEGALTVLFFIQDEPDQTPEDIDVLMQMLADAKPICGGLNCIMGGGLVNTGCLASVPLGAMLGGLGAPPVISAIPAYAGSDPEKFVEVLRDTLAGVIAEKCAEIPAPAG